MNELGICIKQERQINLLTPDRIHEDMRDRLLHSRLLGGCDVVFGSFPCRLATYCEPLYPARGILLSFLHLIVLYNSSFTRLVTLLTVSLTTEAACSTVLLISALALAATPEAWAPNSAILMLAADIAS
jgi:hypothetical protein